MLHAWMLYSLISILYPTQSYDDYVYESACVYFLCWISLYNLFASSHTHIIRYTHSLYVRYSQCFLFVCIFCCEYYLHNIVYNKTRPIPGQWLITTLLHSGDKILSYYWLCYACYSSKYILLLFNIAHSIYFI